MSEIKLMAGLVSGGLSFPGLQTAIFSLCSHMIFPLCIYFSGKAYLL